MYIPPGFTLITCNPIDEDALHLWASSCGAIWHPAGENGNGGRRACAIWGKGPIDYIEARIGTLSTEEVAEWTPLMPVPPQGTIGIELWGGSGLDSGQSFQHILETLFNRWDGYAYDFGFHEWVSDLLRGLLPPERIIRYEPPPPGPLPAWIWGNGKYTRNEAYHDNCDAGETRDKDQL